MGGVGALPVTEKRLGEYCDAVARDEICSHVM